MDIHQTYRFPFASYPAVRLALLFGTGIIIDFHLDSGLARWFSLFGACVLAYLLFEYIYQRALKPWIYYFVIGLYLCSVVCFGGMWHGLFKSGDVPSEAEVIHAYTWQELSFKGEVHRVRQTGANKYQIDVAVDTTVFPGQLLWEKSYNLRAILTPSDNDSIPATLRLGVRLNFTATIYPLEEPRNPYQFDYREYLASNNIYVQAGIQSVDTILQSSRIFSWYSIRREVLSAVDRIYSRETASLAKALLIGYKNNLNRETKTAFSRAGLSHVMAVSGLHVGFILAPFWLVLPLFWTFRCGKGTGL